MGKPSIFTERSDIGSKDELDEYGVWVKSEPEDIKDDALVIESFDNDDFSIDFDVPSDSTEPDVADEVKVSEAEQVPKKGTGEKDNLSTEILLKIANELSTIKSEIANLKAEINAIHNEKAAVAQVKAETADGGTDINASTTGETPEKVLSGFFGDDDGDDTIALTTDELLNVVNDEIVTDEVINDEVITDVVINDEIMTDEIIIDESINNEITIDESKADDSDTDISFDETLSGSELDAVINNSEITSENPPEATDEVTEKSDSPQDDITFDETLSGNELDAVINNADITIDETLEGEAEAAAVEAEDEIDLSILNSEAANANDEISIDLDLDDLETNDGMDDGEISFDNLLGDETENLTVPQIEDESAEAPTTEDIAEAPAAEDIVETPIAEATPAFEDAALDLPVEEDAAFDIDIGPITEDSDVVAETVETAVDVSHNDGGSLSSPQFKKELQIVLTYMDQLLEALPESKIEEFARSDQFEIYKKVFKDLGLV
ncbi:hypothetical protein FACS1894190_01140 [Spirochaetia bacterium]|nr:hypothetical protein FACS1894190_01140 [Spirochaetia bacterium]